MTQAEIENKILGNLVDTGRPEAMVNAMQAIENAEGYETTFSAVMEMENKNYIKLVYCVFPNVINVQLTLVGEAAYKTTRS